MKEASEDDLLRSVALQNAEVVLAARRRAEEALLEAQTELKENRELLQTALAAAEAGAFRWNPETDEFVLGENLRRLLPMEPSQSRTTLASVACWFVPVDGERLRTAFKAASLDHSPLADEFRLADPGGRWFEVRGRMAAARHDTQSWLVGTMTDVTRRREQQVALRSSNEALRTSNELLKATFEQASVGIAIAALDGRFEQVNDKFVEILGYGREQLEAMTFRELTHPDDMPATSENVRRLLAGEIADYQMEKRYIRADGGVVWSHTTVGMLRDQDGKGRRFIGVINDITERKQAEQALAEETRVLETLNQTNTVLASELELESLLQQVTDAATQTSGARFGAFFYHGADEQGEALLLYALSGAPRSAFEHLGHPRPTAVFGPTFRGEGIIRSDDIQADPRYGHNAPHHGMPAGHLPVRSYLAVPVRSRNGDVLGALFFGHPEVGIFTERAERIVAGIAAQAAVAIDNARLYDAVRRAAAERERLLEAERAARSQAERAGLMKDEFLSTLSHELRTPLNAVLGWAQILQSRKGDPELQARGAETIARNAKIQAQLIDDLLDMNRIVSGKVRIEVQSAWLEPVIDAALEAVRPSADAKGITLVKVADAGAGPISGDPTRLQQVVWNLLSNAIKFSDRRGRVAVRLARVESHVELVVSDDGVGIAPEFLPFVFDRFRQADSSTTRAVGGLGLGLAIVKQLVELHGGTVEAHSEGEGKGAEFRLRFPLAPVMASDGPVSPVSVVQDQATSREVNLEGVRVLVVDDEADARAILAVALAHNGAVVTGVGGADEALARLGQETFDLIVSDIGMPAKDGYQFIREVRGGAGPWAAIPAIALTAFARSEDRTRALLAGYQVHLAKPVEPRELVATVGSLMGRFAFR